MDRDRIERQGYKLGWSYDEKKREEAGWYVRTTEGMSSARPAILLYMHARKLEQT